MTVAADPKSHKSAWQGVISEEIFYICKLEKPRWA